MIGLPFEPFVHPNRFVIQTVLLFKPFCHSNRFVIPGMKSLIRVTLRTWYSINVILRTKSEES